MKIELINFEIKGDKRGSLIAIEEERCIPFKIKRVYYIFGTKENARRGCHSHKNLNQVLICVSGNCKVLLKDGRGNQEIIEMNNPSIGLSIKNDMWREIYDFSLDCVLTVLASEYYDEKDYIRNYQEFIKYVEAKK